MTSYNRLTGENRIELHALKKAGLSQKAIAAQLDVAPSTICRELKRNTGLRGYRPKQAQRLSCARRNQTNQPEFWISSHKISTDLGPKYL